MSGMGRAAASSSAAVRTRSPSGGGGPHASGSRRLSVRHALSYKEASGPKMLPPPSARIMQENLEKKIVTSRGSKWLKTFAVLSRDYLCFAKPVNDLHWTADVGGQITTDSLYETFTRHISRECGSLTFEETRAALADLNLCPSDDDFKLLFSQLDQDGNGDLDWQVCMPDRFQATCSGHLLNSSHCCICKSRRSSKCCPSRRPCMAVC